MRARPESGQITVLVIGFAVILLGLVAVVVDASEVVLLRRSLSSLADGAALAAAQSVAEEPLYRGEVGEVVPLDPAQAHRAAAGYLQRAGAARHDGFQLQQVRVDPRTQRVSVVLSARADLPLVGSVTAAFDGTQVVASASARSPIG